MSIGKEASSYFEGSQTTLDSVSPLFEDDEVAGVRGELAAPQRRREASAGLGLPQPSRPAGNVTGALSSAMDITERRKAEEALRTSEESLRQSQKMEAVGQLAGGIAHDFNNLLTAIIGYTDLVLATEEGRGALLRPDLSEIKRAAERASSLTSQILAFSRRQALKPSVVSLNDVLSGMEPLLRRTLGEHDRPGHRAWTPRWP